MRILRGTARNIRAASKIVRAGGLVVYPTDTVYGLGCDPFCIEAVRLVFKVKGLREKPLPILAADVDHVDEIAYLSKRARRAAEKLWPGPITLVIPRRQALPKAVTSGRETVAVRIPNHKVALQLIRLSGGLLVGTSANKTGNEPPRTAYDAAEQLGEEVRLALDDGPAPLGVSSTIVDLTARRLRILREGHISLKDVLNVIR